MLSVLRPKKSSQKLLRQESQNLSQRVVQIVCSRHVGAAALTYQSSASALRGDARLAPFPADAYHPQRTWHGSRALALHVYRSLLQFGGAPLRERRAVPSLAHYRLNSLS